MNAKTSKTLVFVCVIGMLVSAIAQAGQDPQGRGMRVQGPPPDGDVFFFQSEGGPGTFTFVSAEMSFDGKPVKGAPFSAQTVTEHIQTMADGNRIVHRDTGAIYRDSEGRTRREQQIGNVGPYAASKSPVQTTVIHDPVAGTSYVLNSSDKTARKMTTTRVWTKKESDGTTTENITAVTHEGSEIRMRSAGPGGPHGRGEGADANVTTEKLGKQTIEGVEAEGTRSTHVIPAGQFGNEQPITVVSERWYSPELQTVVLSRHSDPRMGETTHKLINIQRSEPAATLFQPPSDYSVQEGGPGMRNRVEVRRPNKQEN